MAKHKRFVCYTHVSGRKEQEPTWFMIRDDDPTFERPIGLSGPHTDWGSIGDLRSDEPGGHNSGAGSGINRNTRFWTDDVHDLSDAAVAALMKLELLAKEGN